MLRTALALAKMDGRVVFFLEPIALYMTKDLYETNDALWLNTFPSAGKSVGLEEGKVYGAGNDLTIITYANGLYLSLRAAKVLKEKHQKNVRVLDLRWLQPLPEKMILEQAEATGKVLVVDECRKSGGIADVILSLIAQKFQGKVKLSRLTATDTYLPLGPAMNLALPTEEQIIEHSLTLMSQNAIDTRF
jgi:2-oxoisovalerate dehydrogenase E1 component